MKPFENFSLEDMPGEVWKDIPGYNGQYKVSNLGRIKSIGVAGTRGWKGTTRILHHRMNHKGYHLIALYNTGQRQNILIARLVAAAFVDNPASKPFVDHIDNDKDNNAAVNLRWVTSSENMQNPISVSRRIETWEKKLGPKTKRPDKRERPVVAFNPETSAVRIYHTMKDTELDGFNPKLVSRVCQKGRRTTKGWAFFYIDDPEATSYLPSQSEYQER